MKLTSIWTIRSMTLAERVRRTYDAAMRGLAARLPKRIAYWSFIHQGVRHMGPDEIVPDVGYTEILARLNGGPR